MSYLVSRIPAPNPQKECTPCFNIPMVEIYPKLCETLYRLGPQSHPIRPRGSSSRIFSVWMFVRKSMIYDSCASEINTTSTPLPDTTARVHFYGAKHNQLSIDARSSSHLCEILFHCSLVDCRRHVLIDEFLEIRGRKPQKEAWHGELHI